MSTSRASSIRFCFLLLVATINALVLSFASFQGAPVPTISRPTCLAQMEQDRPRRHSICDFLEYRRPSTGSQDKTARIQEQAQLTKIRQNLDRMKDTNDISGAEDAPISSSLSAVNNEEAEMYSNEGQSDKFNHADAEKQAAPNEIYVKISQNYQDSMQDTKNRGTVEDAPMLSRSKTIRKRNKLVKDTTDAEAETRRAKKKNYYQNNKANIQEIQRIWYQKNKAKILDNARIYYQKNKARCQENARIAYWEHQRKKKENLKQQK